MKINIQQLEQNISAITAFYTGPLARNFIIILLIF